MLETYSLEQEPATRSRCSTPPRSERAALFTYAQGGLVGALLAAENPSGSAR